MNIGYSHGAGQEDYDGDGTPDPRPYGANQLRGYSRADTSRVVYLYDDWGNRIGQRDYPAPGGTTGTETRYGWDADNRLVKVERQTMSRTGTQWTLTPGTLAQWDYDYDSRGRRTIRQGNLPSDTEVFIYAGGTSVRQFPIADSAVVAWRGAPQLQSDSAGATTYIRGSDMGGGVGGILYSLAAGTPTYQQHNSRGDVTAYTSQSRQILFQAQYDAFGNHADTGTAPAGVRQRASSKEEEPMLGLLNEGFRHRDTETGEFLSRDPAGFVDGPNLYSYVMQNPWSAFDPEGLATSRELNVAIRKETAKNKDLLHTRDTAKLKGADMLRHARKILDSGRRIQELNERLASLEHTKALLRTVASLSNEKIDEDALNELDDRDRGYREAQKDILMHDISKELLIGYGAGKVLGLGVKAFRGLYASVRGGAAAEAVAANSGGSAGRLRLNFGGEGEARGFIDVVPDNILPSMVNGRPLTSQFASGSATDIFARFAPVSPEMARLSQAGTRITILQPAGVAGKQADQLMGLLEGRGTITLDRTFTSQSLQSGGASMAGQELQIIKILVGQ